MKKILLVILIAFLTLKLNAQTEQGKFYIGGNTNFVFNNKEAGYESDDVDYESVEDIKNYEFAPSLGYFVADNLLLGISVPLTYSKNESNSESSDYLSETKLYTVASFVKYYINLSNSSPLKIFLLGQVGLGKGISESSSLFDDFQYEREYELFSYKLGGGLSYFLNNKVSLDFNILYGYDSSELDGEDNPLGYKSIMKGFEPGIGISVYL